MQQRVAGLAAMLGGGFLALTYVFWTVNGLLPSVLTAPPAGSALGTLLLSGLGLGALLLTVSVPTLIARQRRRLGQLGVLGGWLALVGFLLWAVSVLAGPTVVVLPPWVLDADQILLAVGSVVFGFASLDAGVLPGPALLLLSGAALLGLLPTAVPDLLSFSSGGEVFATPAAVGVLGYVALVAFGVAWAWLGFAIWQRA